ncbi:MAG: hypothetical protein D3914_13345, partial [Candidatus Electrothrix sp. LOE2]|nr:hypothetical protein [Candidatus Electrothrix sp. LOE2]
EHKINHTLSYDPLKEEYQVAFAEKDRPEVTRSLEEAEQMMADGQEKGHGSGLAGCPGITGYLCPP